MGTTWETWHQNRDPKLVKHSNSHNLVCKCRVTGLLGVSQTHRSISDNDLFLACATFLWAVTPFGASQR